MTAVQFRRFICSAVMIFTGGLMVWAFSWATSAPFTDITPAHAGLIGCVYAPVAAIFKFAFDAIDGKIDAK